MFVLRWETLILLPVSLLMAAEDLKKRSVPVWIFAAAAAVGICLAVLKKRELPELLLCLLPGALLLGYSVLSEGRFGTGDALFFLTAALYLEKGEMAVLLTGSFLAAALASLGILTAGAFRGRRMSGYRLPFLAFMPPVLLLILFLPAV